MALQKPNSRRLLNKDEEDERKASEKLFLPTFEELSVIEAKAKEDAAKAASSAKHGGRVGTFEVPEMARDDTRRADIGRKAFADAREEIASRAEALNAQKQKAEAARAEFEKLRFAPYSQVVPGLPSAKQTARETMLEEQNKYDKMRMTESEYKKTHKANFGETAEILANSLVAGAVKSGGGLVDIAKATGAGAKKAFAGITDPDASFFGEFQKGFQEQLADEESLYDTYDQYYREMRERQDRRFGTLNTFTGYIEQAVHSVGEMAPVYWAATMSSALFGGSKIFSALSTKADDLMKSGKKGMQMLGRALGKINAGSLGGATAMFVSSSAQSTKEAYRGMEQQNADAAALGKPKKYTDEEIVERSALYGMLNGASEVGLEYAIGGITGTAGSLLPQGNVKNPFLTAVLAYLKGAFGEGFEEGVQTLASFGLKKSIYDPEAETDWREVRDSAIVGMITGVGVGAPSFISNTTLGASAMRDVTSTAKATKNVNTDAQAGVIASVAAAKAKAYGQMAEQVRSTDSENADTVASIYEWAAGRQQEIADAMADDAKRKKIIDENTKDTRAAIQRMRDTNPDFAETERTGRASGAKDEDIRMAGELSSALGKKIRFFREDAKNGTINNGEYHEDTGEIWINTRSKNVKAQIVAHELTHSIEKNDGYRQLVNMAMNKLEAEQKAKGKTLDDLYREKEILYADGGVHLASYDEITFELVAEYVEKRLLTDEASIKSLVRENRTLGQRIREWFDSLLAKMGNASAKEREYIRQMRDMYAKALGESVSAESKVQRTEETVKRSMSEHNTDETYLDAAKRGDMETAQRMVDDAARAAGYNTRKVYHGSHEKFNSFSHETSGGLFNFAERPENAEAYALGGGGGRNQTAEQLIAVDENGTAWEYDPDADVYEAVGYWSDDLEGAKLRPIREADKGKTLDRGVVEGNLQDGDGNGEYMMVSKNANVGSYYLRMKKTLDLVGDPKTANSVFRGIAEKVFANDAAPVEAKQVMQRILWSGQNAYHDFWTVTKSEHATKVFEKFIVPELKKLGYDSLYHPDDSHKTYAVFDENQIKSADNITYDDNGNVIPLSERFKRDSDDIRHSVSRVDEADQTVQQIRNDIAADEARYRELSDIVMSNERFNAMMPDEQNAILDEMQSLRKRIDDANIVVQDMSYEGDAGEYVPMPGDEEAPAEDDGYHGMKAMNHPGDDAPAPTDEDAPDWVKRSRKMKEMLDAGDDVPVPVDEDVPVDRAAAEKQDDVSMDVTRYKEISDLIKDKAKFGSMTPDERNAILEEMNEILERNVDENTYDGELDVKTVYERTERQKQNAEKEIAGIRLRRQQEIESRQKKIDDLQKRYDSKKNKDTKEAGRLFRQIEREKRLMADMEAAYAKRISDLKERIGKREAYMEHYLETRKPETPDERLAARQKKREERKTVAKAETAFKRLGYDIAGAIVDNYEDAAGIIEDDELAAQVESDINKYIKDNQVQFYVDNTAKLLAKGQLKPENVALKGEDLKHAKLLADMYRQFTEVSGNSVREQGKRNTNIVNEELDDIFRGYDWFTEPDKKQKRLREQLQLSLANPEQVMRDVFGDAKIVKDEEGNEILVNVAERLNEYIIRPTIENSARARRQTNQMVSGLRSLGLTKAESGITQIFAEYSNIGKTESAKAVMTEERLRAVLKEPTAKEIVDHIDVAKKLAEDIATQEYGEPVDKEGNEKKSEERKEFEKSIVETIQLARDVNRKRATERALREYKKRGGNNASWNAMEKGDRLILIMQEENAIIDESVSRITEAAAEMRVLLDDMYEAINAVSVIHGAAPIPFRRGYMPHSHRQTEELQKWFNDHMGGLDVTPVQDLPTDIAGKTADRKPNKRWFSHAQQRTGPRTTWDALGNIEDYLRIANDAIYHMDDIRKMRVLERYIRGIYSVARGATGEEQRTRVKNDVMQRLHGKDVDLVFLGLQPPEEKQKISDEDMDLSQMTTFVTWLEDYTNDLAAKQIFNRDIERYAGRKVNNLANTLTSWSSRTMMQYNISSNLKQLSQLGTVSGDVGAAISKDAAVMTLRSMQNLGNGTNELEQKYHISERSTFLAEKEEIEKATFASDKDLTAKQKSQQQHAKDIWDYAWSFTDTTMSRYAVYAYFMEGMNRGMDDTAALHYADTKARNILASRMKGSSPLIFQSKNPILRMFTLFQREPLAAWQDILKTMPREYADMKNETDEKTAKMWYAKRALGRVLGAGIVNTVYATVLGLGTPAMFDILGEPLRALLEQLWREITPDEDDNITWEEAAKQFVSTLGDEIADDIPFANVVSLISNTYAGTEFESRLALNAPDLTKVFEFIGLIGKMAWNGAQLLWSDDAKDIELREELASAKGQVPMTVLDMVMEIVGAAAPAGNQIRKSAKGLIAVLRSGEYTKDGQLKYEVGGVGDSIRAVLLGSSNTRAGQRWIESGFDSLSKTETEAYKALIGAGVSEKRARQYVERVAEAEKVADETQAQAEARMIDGMSDLTKAQKAELYYDMVATDNQRAAVDAAVGAGAKIDDAVETARAIRDSSKKLDRLTALQASDMDTDAREEMYLAMVATKVKDADGNVIGTEDDDLLEALYATGLDFDDFLDAKHKQSTLNADETLSANQRASRFLAWTASMGYTDAQAEVIGENFGFSSGFRVKSETYQKIVDGGVDPDNAVKVSDALAGKTKTADKINAVWSTGLTGNQLDLAVKSVLSEKAYERYRIVVDDNIPIEIYTWALLNADQDADGEKGHGSVNNTERELILSQLALPRKDLSALWLALGGSEKSNPYGGTSSGSVPKVEVPKISVPKVEVPKIELPKIELPKIGG